MTKTEAIDLLDNLIGFVEDSQNNDYDTAVKMAIEALSCSEPKTAESGSVDSEMPEIETDRTNDVLIWKRDAMKIANTIRDCISVDGYWAWIERLKNLPSAQPDKSTTEEKSQLVEEKSTRKLIYLDDAIEAIEELDWYHQNCNNEMVSGANSSEHQAWYKSDDVYKALESVPSAQPELRWIPVSDRLPEEDGEYIICTSKRYSDRTEIARFEKESGLFKSVFMHPFYEDCNKDITAWMPMPERYHDGDWIQVSDNDFEFIKNNGEVVTASHNLTSDDYKKMEQDELARKRRRERQLGRPLSFTEALLNDDEFKRIMDKLNAHEMKEREGNG